MTASRIEGVILRRLRENKIEGYTLEMSREIVALLKQEGVNAARDETNPSADLHLHLSSERRRGLEEAAKLAEAMAGTGGGYGDYPSGWDAACGQIADAIRSLGDDQ